MHAMAQVMLLNKNVVQFQPHNFFSNFAKQFITWDNIFESRPKSLTKKKVSS